MSFFGCYFDPLVQNLNALSVSRCTFTNVDVRTVIPVSALPTNGTTYYITVLDATATPNTFQVRALDACLACLLATRCTCFVRQLSPRALCNRSLAHPHCRQSSTSMARRHSRTPTERPL